MTEESINAAQDESIEDLQARIAALEAEKAAATEAEAPPVPQKKPCVTCNVPTECPTCSEPIGPDGHAKTGVVNYLPLGD